MEPGDVESANAQEQKRRVWSSWVAIFGIVGTLTFTPVVTPAQMGPREEWGRGMREGMGPTGDPNTQKRDGLPPKERTAPAAKSIREEVKQPSRPVPMPHAVASAPLYRERTFLLLVGVAGAAGAFGLYRVTRSRRRPRRGPAAFVTEAVLVVDLVGSTHLATHYGDGLAMQARTILKDRTLAAAEKHGLIFAENTGDGYFMTFPSVSGAVRTAIGLLQHLRDRPPDLSPGPPLGVRVGISYGEILLDERGGRHGATINRAFRLEGLTCEQFTQMGSGAGHAQIPERNRIFLDEEAAQELRVAGIPTRCVGFCSLKGFSGLHRVYEVVSEDKG